MHKCNSVITDTKIQKIMKTKEEIVANWLPRYTKRSLNDFGEYILLTNFNKYVELFADKFNVPVLGRDANMTSDRKSVV